MYRARAFTGSVEVTAYFAAPLVNFFCESKIMTHALMSVHSRDAQKPYIIQTTFPLPPLHPFLDVPIRDCTVGAVSGHKALLVMNYVFLPRSPHSRLIRRDGRQKHTQRHKGKINSRPFTSTALRATPCGAREIGGRGVYLACVPVCVCVYVLVPIKANTVSHVTSCARTPASPHPTHCF